MDASRYFDAMHNAMSTLHAGAQLLLTIRLQDTCGNDAYLEVKQLPGEQSALVCYSTMGRRCLNFQLFRKGWQLCHNADGQLTGRFPSSADSLLSQTDFRAYCREDRLDAARTSALWRNWGSAPARTMLVSSAECPHRRTDHSGKSPWLRCTLELLESGRFPLPAAGRNFVLAG